MPLDFIAAKQQKQSEFGENSIFSMDERMHKFLLSSATPGKLFPVLSKIEDYYSDSVILFGELSQFIKELNQVAGTNSGKKYIEDFLLFINRAISEKNNLYVTAD